MDFKESKADWQLSDQSHGVFFQVRQVIRVMMLEYPWTKCQDHLHKPPRKVMKKVAGRLWASHVTLVGDGSHDLSVM